MPQESVLGPLLFNLHMLHRSHMDMVMTQIYVHWFFSHSSLIKAEQHLVMLLSAIKIQSHWESLPADLTGCLFQSWIYVVFYGPTIITSCVN